MVLVTPRVVIPDTISCCEVRLVALVTPNVVTPETLSWLIVVTPNVVIPVTLRLPSTSKSVVEVSPVTTSAYKISLT